MFCGCRPPVRGSNRCVIPRFEIGCSFGVRDRRFPKAVPDIVRQKHGERLPRALGSSKAQLSASRCHPRGQESDDQCGPSRHVHSGTTRSASVVPRTPTIAAGVSRCTESGESLAIRPDTYAATPRTTRRTNPSCPSAGA